MDDSLSALQAENACLVALLEQHGIEWRTGVCEKTLIKCSECGKRLLISLSDEVIYDHLAGRRLSDAA